MIAKQTQAIIVIIVGMIFTVFIYWYDDNTTEQFSDNSIILPSPRFDKFLLSGVQAEFYANGKKSYTLQAETIIHRNTTIGPFTISLVKEIEINKVFIKVFQLDNNYDQDFLSDSPQEFIQNIVKNINISEPIRRIIIKKLDIRTLKIDSQISRISSGKVIMDIGSKNLTFTNGFLIVSKDNEKLIANKAEWIREKELFFVPDNYLLLKKNGVRKSGRQSFFKINRIGKLFKISK